jgi:hypothetical protein
VRDLSDVARSFYTVVGEDTPFFLTGAFQLANTTTANLTGINIETLTRAVYMLEQRIIKWQRRKRRAEEQDVGIEV